MNESGILGPVTMGIEEAFVALLTGDPLLSGLVVVAGSNRDVVVPALYCFVYCDVASPLQPTGPRYKANVAIALVTNIDDQNNDLRKEWWGKILQVISRKGQEFEVNGVTIAGWYIQAQGEISADQQTSDVARLSVGAIL